MKRVGFLVAACCVVATACSDQPAETRVAGPNFQTTASTCISTTAIEDGIKAIFPSGGDRSSALSKFRQVVKELGPRPPGPDTATAQNHALNLVDFILQKYEAGRLIGGQSVTTQATLAQVLNGILCTSGLQPIFGPGSLGPDGAAAFIYPTTPDTTVVTETKWAGVQIPAANVTVPTLVTISRLPDSPGPLLTQLDQYPIFYEYHTTSPFANDVLVGICLAANVTPPDPTRLRLAHNVAPYTMGSIQILPLATAPFIDCTNAPIASAGGRWGFDLARAHGWLERGFAFMFLPKPLYAVGTGGVGGTVRTFSPFGAVDTLAVVTPATPYPEVHSPSPGTVATPTPSVFVRTPTGRAMQGIGVTFTVTLGGGSATGGSTVTDVNGQASVGSWTLGTAQRRNELLVTPAPMQGAGYVSSGFEVPFTYLGFPRTFP